MMGLIIDAMERGRVPDPAIRWGIRKLCGARLKSLSLPTAEARSSDIARYVEELKRAPLAVHTDEANEQHYEVPSDFFRRVLGRHLKYSSGYWPEGCDSLDESEREALEISCQRAELADGMNVLELGCGWGSLTLFMARKFPRSKITAISNSASQKKFIDEQAKIRGLDNITVLTRNIADVVACGENFAPFDRIVSIEMFEHLRNYDLLFRKVAEWLAPGGKLFVHVFTHKEFAYFFDTEGDDNWMGRYFFTGGQMPSHGLLPRFQDRLSLEEQWSWDGTHYSKTSNAWLRNMDRHRDEILALFDRVYGRNESLRWFNRWRIFFMACAELFGYRGGTEWGVSHYRFRRRDVL